MLRKNWKVAFLVVIAFAASTTVLAEYRRISVLEDRLGCAATWLEKAKSLHMLRMNEPANFTQDAMRKVMDAVDSAYVCATKDPSSGHAPGAGAFGEHGDMPPHK